MRKYLIDTFRFNDTMNRRVLEKIKIMPEPGESVKLFSHIINSQNKWMARINREPGAQNLSWFEPVYEISELEGKWDLSLTSWVGYLESIKDEDVLDEIRFTGDNGASFGALIKDIGIQLNNHSVHHRAQICYLMRKQNIEPPFVEYIGTVRKSY